MTENSITTKEIIKEENLVYQKTRLLTDDVMHYCPGCGHSTTHRIIAEIIEEMDIQSETIGVAPVGCSVLMYNYMDVDMQEAAHGRAPAVATAIKRLLPEKVVFTYQGDGDLAAIGTAETIHACNRGENITMGNYGPDIENLTITSPLYNGSNATGGADFWDLEGDVINCQFNWYVNSTSIYNHTQAPCTNTSLFYHGNYTVGDTVNLYTPFFLRDER